MNAAFSCLRESAHSAMRRPCPQMQTRNGSQHGQALVEAFVVLLAAAVLWMAIAWLGRIQDVSLQASHAARHLAFQATRLPAPDTVVLPDAFFNGSRPMWRGERGQPLIGTVLAHPHARAGSVGVLSVYGQPGRNDADAGQLRKDWNIADTGIVVAGVSLRPLAPDAPVSATDKAPILSSFDRYVPTISRHTAILWGAGHATSDGAAAGRLAASGLAWAGPADASKSLGQRVAGGAAPVDAAWGRPDPVFDWLQPWADYLPQQYLQP